MEDEDYAKECLEEAQQKSSEKEPDLTSWCGNGDCHIVNYLLKKLSAKKE